MRRTLAVSANDGKVVLVNGVGTVPANPLDDIVTIINLAVSRLKVELKAPSSVAGPPQNVAVAPDQSLALVAFTMKLDPADPKKQVPDNRLSVIDLKANQPVVIATLEAGLSATGTAINPAGTLALVANYREGTVSVFTISGNKLTAAGKVDFGNLKSRLAGVAFTPDGKAVLVTRDGDHRISVLSVDGSNVTDTKRFMTRSRRGQRPRISKWVMTPHVLDLVQPPSTGQQHHGRDSI